ncbi:integrase core domain protein [Burkholderia pseudomallei]|nr:integrase core domain protein [Burkholderia pseudomallei]
MRRLALMGVVRGPRTFYSRRNGEVTDPLSLWLQELIARRGYNCTAVALANKNARIEFRPIPPRSPHLNGKVERSQLTDRNEFWSHHAPIEQAIDLRIEEWQFDYNWPRPHGSLGGKTPIDCIAELGEITPLAEEVESAYDERKERIRHREWRVDKFLGEHHRRASEPVSPTGATGSDAPKKRSSRK